ncbi:MAG: PrsW family glutamic-type intramembrane protease [Candidatus Paceibacterota bacterium]|jgi:RsiW-degrading membrane proteinase PrsW (M82 family)
MNLGLEIILAFLPGLIWLLFFLQEDINHDPKRMIAKVFFAGMLSAIAALLIEIVTHSWLQGVALTIPRIIEDNINIFVGFAFIEELTKFIFVYAVVRRSSYFDEPLDAMIYLVTGALGFATAENLFLVFSSHNIQDAFSIIVLRFIGATLLHALASGVMGHHWARGIKYKIEGWAILIGLALATGIHALFNYFIFKYSDLLVYPTAFLFLVGFFVLYDFEELKQIEEAEGPPPVRPPAAS